MTHTPEGPCVLHAILSCLDCCKFDLGYVYNGWIYNGEVYNFEADSIYWGTINIDVKLMLQKNQVYFEQILPHAKKSKYFPHQFELSCTILNKEMYCLSKAIGAISQNADSKTPFRDFQCKLPLIFEVLQSALGYSASNTQIVAMLHGFI